MNFGRDDTEPLIIARFIPCFLPYKSTYRDMKMKAGSFIHHSQLTIHNLHSRTMFYDSLILGKTICPNSLLGNILDELTFADNFTFYGEKNERNDRTKWS